MRIDQLLWEEETELHVWSRHQVSVREVEEAAYRHGLAVRGRERGVYEVFGRTDAGRYLMIALRHCGGGMGRVITAREMTRTERRRYRRHAAH